MRLWLEDESILGAAQMIISVVRYIGAFLVFSWLSVTQAAITTLPYYNDFTVSEPFTETGATWALNTGPGTYTNTFSANGVSSSATAAVTGLGGAPASALDFVMSSKFTITANAGSGTSNNTVGFAALSTNAAPTTNWLLADIATNGTSAGLIRILRFPGSGNVAVGSAPFTSPLVIGTEYTMTLSGTYTPANNLDLLFEVYDGASLVATTSGTVLSADVTANLTGNNFGLRNRTNATGTFTVAFNDFSIAAIPEPSTYVAGALLLGLLLWRRRAGAV